VQQNETKGDGYPLTLMVDRCHVRNRGCVDNGDVLSTTPWTKVGEDAYQRSFAVLRKVHNGHKFNPGQITGRRPCRRT